MFIVELPNSKKVGFHLPDDWWERRGDVCLYAIEGKVGFVDRSVAGYSPILLFDPDEPIYDTDLTASIAVNFCAIANETILELTQLEVDEIVTSSMFHLTDEEVS